MEIFWRTLLVEGSIRFSVPFLSVTSQTLSSLAAIPPSGAAGGIGSVAETAFLAASMRTRSGIFPQTGTQMLPNPEARPEQASLDTPTLAATLLVAGSI